MFTRKISCCGDCGGRRRRPAPARRRNILEERRFLAPVLIAPAVIFVIVVVGVPLGWAIYLSLTDAIGGSLSGKFIGIDNFTNAWHDQNFRNALENTLIITFAAQVIVVIGAAILSHFLVRDFRGKWFLRLLVILPWAAPVSLVTLGWLWIFDSLFSVVNWTLGKMHLLGVVCGVFGVHGCGPGNPPQWLGSNKLAMFAIIVVHAWRVLPFAVVIFIAGLASIPTEVEDAAKIDGATGLRKLLYVTCRCSFRSRSSRCCSGSSSPPPTSRSSSCSPTAGRSTPPRC